MANVWGANRKDERRSSRNMIFEYLVPSSCWTEDTDCHCLLIDLPGFKKEEVRIRADNNGHVIVRGERQANNNKIIHFEQSFKVPAGCNIEETRATFEDEIFYVTVPKKVTPEKEVSEAQNSTSVQEEDQNTVSE
ncbi:hypothetical protein Pfo_011292 [Paulownia fortunei]|nr:hypothetical protein Pfo_011292 [Paulownia fortunei]